MFVALACLLAATHQQADLTDFIAGVVSVETDIELIRASRIAGLTAAQVNPLRAQLKPDIKAAATRRVAKARLRSNGFVDRGIAAAIAAKLSLAVGMGGGDRYLADWTARNEFLRESVVSQAIVILDQRVRLSTSQAEQVQRILLTGWAQPQHYPLELLFYGMPREDLKAGWPRGFPVPAIKAVLSKSQIASLDWQVEQVAQMALANRFESTEEALGQVARQHAAIIAERYRLNDTAASKVKLIFKKAKKLGWQLHAEGSSAFSENPGGPFAPILVEAGTPSPCELLRCDSSWESLLSTALNRHQISKFDANRKARAQRAHDAMIRLLLVQVAQDSPVLSKEQSATVALFSKSLPIDQRGLRISHAMYLNIADLPPQAVFKAIGMRNHPAFHSWIADETKMLKRESANRKEESPEDR